jgi:hypothetical protein
MKLPGDDGMLVSPARPFSTNVSGEDKENKYPSQLFFWMGRDVSENYSRWQAILKY